MNENEDENENEQSHAGFESSKVQANRLDRTSLRETNQGSQWLVKMWG